MGLSRMAEAIASRWHVPAESIVQRLEQGRVRVKSDLPEAQARKVADDLVAMGAMVSVVDSATGAPLSLVVAPVARPSAFGGAMAALEFEEVDDDEGVETQVSSTTGTMYTPDAPAAVQESLAPAAVAPPPLAPATLAPLATPNLRPPVARVSASMAAPARVSPAVSAQTQAARRPPPGATFVEAFFFERPRTRILAGFGIALLLGFIASAVYVSGRDANYQVTVGELVEYQSQEFSLSQWQTDLPEVRSEALTQLRSQRTTMTLGSVLIWVVVGGGFLFAWFRYLS